MECEKYVDWARYKYNLHGTLNYVIKKDAEKEENRKKGHRKQKTKQEVAEGSRGKKEGEFKKISGTLEGEIRNRKEEDHITCFGVFTSSAPLTLYSSTYPTPSAQDSSHQTPLLLLPLLPFPIPPPSYEQSLPLCINHEISRS